MVQINFAKREINCKLVYYGPGLSGKTTNLEVVHKKAPASKKGELTSIATEGDRTLFFDYMPLELGKVGGMNTKFQLYTVPGQVYYNATRKLVLQGADGVVFVADSQPEKMEENLESFANLEENLREQGLDPKTIPMVLQWNKRDLPSALPPDELDRAVNKYGVPTFEAVAVTGEGVFPTLKKLAQMVLEKLNKEYGLDAKGKKTAAAPAKPPAAAAPKPEPKPEP
ncbi:MAG TPA: GTPase, partial [Planctomycetes bacterium]|nr:GTPase [Planctomycetota bacterium]